MRRRFLALGLPAVILIAAACTGGGGGGGGGSQLSITGSDYKFEPVNVTARANQPVTVSFRNTASQAHDWTVSDFNAQVVAQGGQTQSLTFTPTRTGQFKIVCAQPGHEVAGMVGQLTVQ